MEEDPLAALLDQMAAAQRGGQPSEDSGKAPVVGEKRGKAKGRHGEGSSSSRPQPPEPPPSAEELSIYRPDVQPPAGLLSFPRARLLPPSTSSSAPDPSLELQRQKLMATLTVLFLNTVRSLKLDVRMPTLERWTISQNQRGAKDPVLPSGDAASVEARAGAVLLLKELREAGASKEDAGKLCKRMGQAAVKALRQLGYSGGGAASKATAAHGGSGHKVTVVEEAGGHYSVRFRSTTLTINRPHYLKLQRLFRRHGSVAGESEADHDRRFKRHLFCLLSRYSAMAGGTDRGGGMQGALNEDCFEVLLRHFDCRFECFASPLNSRYGRFCSAFADVDMAFGSIGSLFDFRPTQGCYEANPPFVPTVIHRMAKHMDGLLAAAPPDSPLCFIVVIPAWSEERNQRAVQAASKRPWQMLHDSPFCVRHVLCRAQEHGYCEGGQHQRPTRYKTSRFDTSIFFLQNQAATTHWPVTDQACEALLRAFSSKHEEETKRRREGRAAGKGVGLTRETGGGSSSDEDEDAEAVLRAVAGSQGLEEHEAQDGDDDDDDEQAAEEEDGFGDGGEEGDMEEEAEEEEEERAMKKADKRKAGGHEHKEKRSDGRDKRKEKKKGKKRERGEGGAEEEEEEEAVLRPKKRPKEKKLEAKKKRPPHDKPKKKR